MSKELKLLEELRNIYKERLFAIKDIDKMKSNFFMYESMINILNHRINTIEECQKYWTNDMLRELNTRSRTWVEFDEENN